MNQIHLIKQKTIAQIVKEFLNNELFGQRTTLIQLLINIQVYILNLLRFFYVSIVNPFTFRDVQSMVVF